MSEGFVYECALQVTPFFFFVCEEGKGGRHVCKSVAAVWKGLLMLKFVCVCARACACACDEGAVGTQE